MEELLGAGINESQSIQLLRSMMILQPEKEKYATLDFFSWIYLQESEHSLKLEPAHVF